MTHIVRSAIINGVNHSKTRLEDKRKRNAEGGPPELHDEQTLRERRLFGIIVVVGIAALFFGFFQLGNTIRKPFRIAGGGNTNTLGPTSAAIASLSKKDTDQDNLSDYDELYVYLTSPYLADSDSDGKKDQAEVSGGTDPNCAEGSVCSPLALVNTSEQQNTNESEAANTTVNEATNSSLAGSGLTPNDLRVALRNAGAPASTLEGLDDATLLQLYQEVAGTGALTNTSVTTNTTTVNAATNTTTTNGTTNSSTLPTGTIDYNTLQNLTSDQIREFLVQGGADPTVLSEVDDATLRAIFAEAISDLNTTP